MQNEYKYPLITKGKNPETIERNLNKLKLRCKEKALKEFIKMYSILDISRISFVEMITKSFGMNYFVYNIKIISDEF